jgi:hypothetical protein
VRPVKNINPKTIAVISINDKPLGYTNWSKASKLLSKKLAVLRTNKLGIRYIQILKPVGNNIQPLVLADDPGSKWDGVAVGSKNKILLTGMFALPKGIAKKIGSRADMRGANRFRNTPQREEKFNNRTRPDGWIAPSQKAKVDFRILVIKELAKIYPISTYIVEDVKFNHYKNRWGKYFSTVEIGKTKLYKEISKLGILIKYSGKRTHDALKKYGIAKGKDKSAWVKESHANDCVAMLCDYFGKKIPDPTQLYCWKRYQFYRRQLHKRQPSKGGFREKYGGSWLTDDLYKGDVIIGSYAGQIVKGLACSISGKSVGIATFEKSQKWIVPLHTVQRLYRNPILMEIH